MSASRVSYAIVAVTVVVAAYIMQLRGRGLNENYLSIYFFVCLFVSPNTVNFEHPVKEESS